MGAELIADLPNGTIRPRAGKTLMEQAQRKNDSAEVFTPSWICNKQINAIDSEWFGRPSPFNEELDKTWEANEHRIQFPEGKDWTDYVSAKRLEVSCGEAPYLVSRYDTVTGEPIRLDRRIGILDRKMRLINENSGDGDWYDWVLKAFGSTYGFELQGDNVLLARENLLYSFIDYYVDRFGEMPPDESLMEVTGVITKNIWQMDGTTFAIPRGREAKKNAQRTLFGESAYSQPSQCPHTMTDDLHGLDAVIGNPPYQKRIGTGGNSSSGKQLFPIFIMAAIDLNPRFASLITPSRWFTGDGQDKSFLKLRKFLLRHQNIVKLFNYPQNNEVFADAEIKGGVSYFLYKRGYGGPVEFHTIIDGEDSVQTRRLFEDGLDIVLSDGFDHGIIEKITNHGFESMMAITNGRNAFGIVGKEDIVNRMSRAEPFDGAVKLACKKKEVRWTSPSNVTKCHEVMGSYKVFISKSAGDPSTDRRVIGKPVVSGPGEVCTDSLIPIGCFESKTEAENLSKYLQTKFVRYAIGIMKASQNVFQNVYRFVPMQDFTPSSDIDWSQPTDDVDLQLYRKYGLSTEQMNRIEESIDAV